MRIVSLLPSATEIVCALGLRDALVGRSHECDWPAGVSTLPAVSLARIDSATLSSAEIDRAVARAIEAGDELYAIDEDVLDGLAPDLIVTQSLCTVCAVSGGTVRALASRGVRAPAVLELEPDGIDGILASVREIARAAGVEAVGEELAGDLAARLDAAAAPVREVVRRPRVVVLEWLDPPFAAGHWVPEQVALAGGREQLGRARMPSFPTTWEAVRDVAPEVVVLAPCGYGAAEVAERAARDGVLDALAGTPAAADRRVHAVDANAYFSRPGPRVVEGVALLASLLHPTLAPA
jgi:iron complex transport system substrate-binding protein